MRFVEDHRRVTAAIVKICMVCGTASDLGVCQDCLIKEQDALLAEAAEVLRAIDVVMMDQKSYPSILKAYGAIEKILVNRVEPLLDKLEGK